ncbi:MAG: CinA family nicotinamide mononucleotide deamidase-related protein [Candidatus Cloacimonetes bacterium]|nr:CinA family nicotinamide mononucleotide deamidase-related protein [Candidatus Cloacimonadota bacterium]
MSAALITIGNEILLGRTLNSNLAHIGAMLAEVGLPLTESRTVRDEPDEITRALAELWPHHRLVITTGGLGPTKDDVTKQTIAAFFGRELKHDEHTWERVKQRFAQRHIDAPDINRGQALVPDGFEVLDNDRGTAPGLAFEADGRLFFALPGVPAEMEHLLEARILPRLRRIENRAPLWMRMLHTSGIPESTLAERLNDIDPPDEVQLAWLPQPGQISLRVYGPDHAACEKLFDELLRRLGDDVWGTDEQSPSLRLHDLLRRRELTLAVAESCTGGLVCARLTAHPGASDYLLGGVTAYSNAVKTALLGVSQETLEQHGAVSEATARAMAEGTRARLGANVGLAVTGIAGPAGGSDDKPVGTVHIAVATSQGASHELLHLSGNRQAVQAKAADRLMLLALRVLKELKESQ